MSKSSTITASIKSTLNRLYPSDQQWERFLKHWHILNGSWLKILAIVTMTIDHAAALYFWNHPSFHITLFTIGNRTITLYVLMRLIGRLAFPIFSFLLVEGFLHTHNRIKYGVNLFLFALISEIPFNLACSNALFYHSQNVFFTLFIMLCLHRHIILGQLLFAVACTSDHCLIGLDGSKRREGGQRGWKMRLEKLDKKKKKEKLDKMRHGSVFNG